MSTMVPLRIVAIGSNVLFASYGALAHIYPILALHLVLLPVNVARLIQIQRLIWSVKAAHFSDLSIERLLPFMKRRVVEAGQALIKQDQKADHLYYLVHGRVQIPELGKVLEPGAVFGESDIFARDQKRTASVVCIEDCEIYEMSENKEKQLYFQDRAFGLAVLQLIIARLMDSRRHYAC